MALWYKLKRMAHRIKDKTKRIASRIKVKTKSTISTPPFTQKNYQTRGP